MSRLNVGNFFNENEDGAPVVSGISTFSSPNYFVPPSGSTAERPQNPGEGMIRFNTDSGHLEYYTGTHWADVIVNNNELGDQNNTNSSGGTGTRGVMGLGRIDTPSTNRLDYVSILTLGNAQDFGDLNNVVRRFAAASSSTRGLFAGGFDGSSDTDTIDFITISSTGNATDFGNLLGVARTIAGLANATRGVFGGNESPTQLNVIQYVTIASTGNAVDFGDTSRVGHQATTCSSSVRGLFAGVFGGSSPLGDSNIIDYITISTTGNAQDFGDLSSTIRGAGGGSNATRGIFAGGYDSPATINTIEFATIATTGNTQDFGDLTQAQNLFAGCPTSPTRALFAGGYTGPGAKTNRINSVEIATTGNAIDFGDLTTSCSFGSAGSCSNGHGGL